MREKAVVLLSAGLDSTVNLYKAHCEYDVVLALTFDYGQRAALQEISRSKKICHGLEIPHKVVSLPWVGELGGSGLTDTNKEVPLGVSVDIYSEKMSLESASKVWVPNRNGVFLNIAASFAESLEAQWIIPGFNFEEAATFPDNSTAFLRALDRSFSFSTANQVKTLCYTEDMNKAEMVGLGRDLKIPFDLLWSCYLGGHEVCGQCESCQRYQRALKEADA